MSTHTPSSPRITAASFAGLKAAGRPIVVLTAYDYHMARLVESAGVDAILVGDSLGMTVLGHESTLPVTMDDMERATRAVATACRRALVIADMPFMSFQVTPEETLRNAGRLMARAGAGAVKVEGATPTVLEGMRRMVEAGIPVMAHLGLTPQSFNVFGGFKTQAKEEATAALLIEQCREVQRAGAFSVVLECIPAELARAVSADLDIPTIGIGAGAGCDGQVQVFHDLLGFGDFTPRHAKRYAELGEAVVAAVSAYAEDVRALAFPGDDQSTHAESGMVEAALSRVTHTDKDD